MPDPGRPRDALTSGAHNAIHRSRLANTRNLIFQIRCLMAELRYKSPALKRSIWFGIAVGWLVQLGLKAILPIVVLFGVRLWSLLADSPSLWLENPGNSSHPVWYALQASVFIGSVLAGSLATMLVPRRSLALPIALVVLSLIAIVFEQFPSRLSTTVAIIWAGGPCVGLVIGVLLGQRFTHGDV